MLVDVQPQAPSLAQFFKHSRASQHFASCRQQSWNLRKARLHHSNRSYARTRLSFHNLSLLIPTQRRSSSPFSLWPGPSFALLFTAKLSQFHRSNSLTVIPNMTGSLSSPDTGLSSRICRLFQPKCSSSSNSISPSRIKI